MSFNKETVQPADKVTVNLAAHRGSSVGFFATDKRSTYLGSGNGITVDEVWLDFFVQFYIIV